MRVVLSQQADYRDQVGKKVQHRKLAPHIRSRVLDAGVERNAFLPV
jgi:hypothetical protein